MTRIAATRTRSPRNVCAALLVTGLIAGCGQSPCEDTVTLRFVLDQVGYPAEFDQLESTTSRIDTVGRADHLTICQAKVTVRGPASEVMNATLGGVARVDQEFALMQFRAGISSVYDKPAAPPAWPRLAGAYADILSGPQIRDAANTVFGEGDVEWSGTVQYEIDGQPSAPPRRWRWTRGDNPIFHAAATLERLAASQPKALEASLQAAAHAALTQRQKATKAGIEELVALHEKLKRAEATLTKNESILQKAASQWKRRLRTESFSVGLNDLELTDLAIQTQVQGNHERAVLVGVAKNFGDAPVERIWVGLAVAASGSDTTFVEPLKEIDLSKSPIPGQSAMDFQIVLNGPAAEISSAAFQMPEFRDSGDKHAFVRVQAVAHSQGATPDPERFRTLEQRLKSTRAHLGRVRQEITLLEQDYASAKAQFERGNQRLGALNS